MSQPAVSWLSRLAHVIGIDEVATEAFRPKLLGGIVTGYTTAILFGLLVFLGRTFHALPGLDWAFVLVAIKLTTNTLAAIAWKQRKLVTPLSALNITADVLVMTGAVYFTGGVLSPLVAIYFVEVAVMALLTNVGLTLTTTAGSFVCYASMAVMVDRGVLPTPMMLISSPDHVTTVFMIFMIAFVGMVTFGPGAYVAIIVDALRRNERALERRAHDLVEAGRAKSEFTANITHELRTPLHGILGLGELLEDGIYGPTTEKQLGAVRSIRSSAQSLLELIDSLLVLARAEAIKLEVASSTVDVGEVVTSVVATGKMLVGRRTLDVRAETGELPLVQTDRTKLVQILVNLLANAIKFTPDDGRVTVEARAETDAVVIAVRDTGRGISPDVINRIFEPYFQADGSPIREHGGAGIGLSVVRALSDVLGITVSVESALGVGSTFTLRLPTGTPG